MPTQGVGFLDRKIDHRSIGVNLLIDSGGTVIWFFISGIGTVIIGIVQSKNRNHKPDRIVKCISKCTIKISMQ